MVERKYPHKIHLQADSISVPTQQSPVETVLSAFHLTEGDLEKITGSQGYGGYGYPYGGYGYGGYPYGGGGYGGYGYPYGGYGYGGGCR